MRHVACRNIVLCGIAFTLLECGSPAEWNQRAADSPSDTVSAGAGGSQGTESESGAGATIGLPDPDGGSSSTSTATSTSVDTQGCGDGIIQLAAGETCDDGNSTAGDGCAADCKSIDADFACPTPGELCVSTVHCGDSKITGAEQCDDGDADSGDGCSAGCAVESGWVCPSPGAPCWAAQCGDGVVAGSEECDDGNATPTSGDGCSAACKLEAGFACDPPGVACHLTVCNDGVKEGSEPCDDGNNVVGDGCNPFCELEPNCAAGACHSTCGDGLMLPGDNEACDDGNSKNGDGCSASCQIESGFTCQIVPTDLPDALSVPVTFRDMIALPAGGSVKHPDFQTYSGSQATKGMVADSLGPDGKPVYTGICESGAIIGPCPYGAQTTNQAAFDQWYRDAAGVNLTTVTQLTLQKQPNGSYYFPDTAFFPLNGAGFVAMGLEAPSSGNNFGFTSEVRYWFEYKGDEQLLFSGDDDVWVFVGGKLVVDLGGLHPPVSGSVTLDAAHATSIGLELGKVYETVLFHAERHTNNSNFNLTLNGFVHASSVCETTCGDGIVAGDETCDDGVNDGAYGGCMPDCTPAPYCGNGTTEAGHEECDDGTNLSPYSFSGAAGCAPGCKYGAFCGDGVINSVFGEECDDGSNAGGYGMCGESCTLDMRCGDGIVQFEFGEECDDGNTVSGDGCSGLCTEEAPH